MGHLRNCDHDGCPPTGCLRRFLLPCPFCGGEPVEFSDGDGPATGRAVRCRTCGAATAPDLRRPHTGVQRWNTRWVDGRLYEWVDDGTKVEPREVA